MKREIRIFLTLLCFLIYAPLVYPSHFEVTARIETVRKDNLLTLIFTDYPEKENYYIIEKKAVIGEIRIIGTDKIARGKGVTYRAIAEYKIMQGKEKFIRAGAEIALKIDKKIEKKDYGGPKYQEKLPLENNIISEKDKREMILITGGECLIGSEDGDRDEAPEHIIYIDHFYIDKYEVSNSDYLYFMKQTNASAPVLWENGAIRRGEKDFPVVVTYSEAEKYAKWAGKRLPEEEEWEKAARGAGIRKIKGMREKFTTVKMPLKYPWGNKFMPGSLNSAEFWDDEKTGEDIKKEFKKGLLPVKFFDGKGNSPYGVVNMAGNAPEWTSSWYRAYKGNNYYNKRYGNQVKVIRGGAWYSPKYRTRVSSREIGGIPNKYNDYIAGFRCVKDVIIGGGH